MSGGEGALPGFRGLAKAFGPGLRGTIAVAFGAAVLAGVASLFLPKTYKSDALILPTQQTSAGSSLLGMAAGAGLSDVLSGLGNAENPLFTYPEILQSRRLLERILLSPYPPGGTGNRTVMDAIQIRGSNARRRTDNGIRALHKLLQVHPDPRAGLISVSAVTRDSLLSAYVVHRALEELDRFNVESRASQGQATREFVQGRLDEAKRDLAKAEGALASFREANLRIGNSPQLLLEQARLQREVETRSELYRLLARQFELARIEEKRDTPTFSVIDPPVPPVRKYRPLVLLNACAAMLLAVGLRVLLYAVPLPARLGWGRGPS